MEFVFDNLPIVIFIAITIAARILQARAKAAARKKEEAPPAFVPAPAPDDDNDELRYRLDPDEDETPRPARSDLAGLVDYARTRGASAYTIEKARSLLAKMAEDGPRFEAPANDPAGLPPERPPAASSADAAPLQTEAGNDSPAGRAVGGPEKSGALLPGLERLSPLQQAVCWAEILGKPQGMA
jgi:hypothetical protein